MRVQINGNELYVEILGEANAPTLITHHGAPGLSSHAEPKAAFGPLADEFRVVVFDARGCGASEGKPPFTNDQWTRDVEGLRNWLGVERVFVAGGSYGGFIAMRYAIDYPQRAAAVVLRNTAADGEHREAGIERALRSDRTQVDRAMWDRYMRGGLESDEDLAAAWRTLLPLYDFDYRPEQIEARLRATPFRYQTQNAAMVNMATYDIKDELPRISCPTLVTVGRHDWIAQPRFSEQIADLIPDSRLVVFERSGHSPQVEEAPRFQRVVREFLREVRDGQHAERAGR